MAFGLIELLLVYGAVIVFAIVEYRRTSKLLEKTRAEERQKQDALARALTDGGPDAASGMGASTSLSAIETAPPKMIH